MKTFLIALGAAALLAGCASPDNNNGMGGTSDQDTMKTDSIHSAQNGGSLNSNSDTSGMGSDTAPTTQTTPQQ
jgi:hypothetical protein